MEAEVVYTATRCKASSGSEYKSSCGTESASACGSECRTPCGAECAATNTESCPESKTTGTKSSSESKTTSTKSSTKSNTGTSEDTMDVMMNVNNTMIKYIGLAQAYVPWQNWSEPMSPEQSLRCGTAFAGLTSAYQAPKGGGKS